uniref:Rho GTPase-activating protein 27 n=1 Tax=Schistocephalus solidus TaxID=70667 RepID=A0A0X3NMI0_SCHSO
MEALKSSPSSSADSISTAALLSPIEHAPSLRSLPKVPTEISRPQSTASCPNDNLNDLSVSEALLGVRKPISNAPAHRATTLPPSLTSEAGKPPNAALALPPRFGEVRTDMPPVRSFNAYEEEQQVVSLRHSRSDAASENRPESGTRGWTLGKSEEGQTYYIHPETKETWVAAQAPTGEQYFYEPQSRVSVWELPDLTSPEDGETQELSTPHPVTSSAAPVTRMSTSFTRGSILGAPPESSVISTIDLSEAQAKFGARQQPSPSATPKGSGFTFFGDKKRHSTDSLDQAGTIDEADGRFSVQRISRDHITGPLENKLRATERRGLVNRTKLSVNGERLTKKWIPSLLVLVGPTLYVYKDVKGQKINLQPSKPELQMQVKNLVIEVADSSCTGRDNCLLVRDTTDSSNVVEYLFQAPSLLLRKAWETAFQYSQNWVQEDRFAQLAFSRKHPPSVDSKIITMLQNFFRIRPSLETLRARGILKNEPVFASVLCELCAREQTKVPTFVTRVIGAIEARGLNVPGLYRKSGNAATIQNLRNQVNHYDYSLNSDEWGVFELSDSLKLFLRELKEPLFCYSIYGCLMAFYKTHNKATDAEKLTNMWRILDSMPECHFMTAKAIFLHMHKVASHSAENQMSSENLALVLAPNIMWPELPTAQFDTYAQASFCCAQFIIVNAPKLFDAPPSLPVTF